MEIINPNTSDKDKESESSDSVEKSKKNKKKSTKAPLPFVSKAELKQDKETQSAKSKETTSQRQAYKEMPSIVTDIISDDPKDKNSNNPETNSVQEDIEQNSSQEESSADTSAYMGELIIDHSDEIVAKADQELHDSASDVSEEVPGIPVLESLDQGQDSIDIGRGVYDMTKTNQASELTIDGTGDIPASDGFENTMPETVQQTLDSHDYSRSVKFDQEQPSLDNDIDASKMIDPNLFIAQSAEYPTVSTSSNESARIQSTHHESIRSEKRGLSRGVVTGLLFGWWLGRRNRSKQDQAIQRAVLENNKAIEQATISWSRESELSGRRLSLIERTQNELSRVIGRNKQEVDSLSTILSKKAYKPKYYEIENNNTLSDQLDKNMKKPVTEQVTEIDLGNTKPDNIVETSAWHRVELDKKTGRLAENKSVEYGEEFDYEQSQEKLAREAVTAQTAAQLGTALFAGAESTASKPYAANSPSSRSSDTSSRPTNDIGQEIIYISQQIVSNTKNPSIWLIAFVLVMFLFVVGIL